MQWSEAFADGVNVGAVIDEAMDYLSAPLRGSRKRRIGGEAILGEVVEGLKVGTILIEETAHENVVSLHASIM